MTRFALIAVVLGTVLTPAAQAAFNCPARPVEQRLASADVAFVGAILAERPAREPGRRIYRFSVEQRVKGPLGSEVELHSEPLVDVEDTPVPVGAEVGVLGSAQGGRFATSSCGLSDPAALLAGADEPHGEWIKLSIGIAIAALVVAYSLWRVRRRGPAIAPRS